MPPVAKTNVVLCQAKQYKEYPNFSNQDTKEHCQVFFHRDLGAVDDATDITCLPVKHEPRLH